MKRLSKDDKQFLASALDWAIANETEFVHAYKHEVEPVAGEQLGRNANVITLTRSNIARMRKLQVVLRTQAKEPQ